MRSRTVCTSSSVSRFPQRDLGAVLGAVPWPALVLVPGACRPHEAEAQPAGDRREHAWKAPAVNAACAAVYMLLKEAPPAWLNEMVARTLLPVPQTVVLQALVLATCTPTGWTLLR